MYSTIKAWDELAHLWWSRNVFCGMLTNETVNDGQQTNAPGDAIARPLAPVDELGENKRRRATRRQYHQSNKNHHVEHNMTDPADQLNHRQKTDAPDIGDEESQKHCPHQKGAVPALGDVCIIVEDNDALDLGRGEEDNACGSGLLGEDCNPALHPSYEGCR